MKKGKSLIVSICYLALMAAVVFMFNSSSDHEKGGEHGSAELTGKAAELNAVVEKIAATDNRPVKASEEKNPLASKISPDVAIAKLQQGNIRFAKGESEHPNLDPKRRLLAVTENQADHAYATVLACSDSRVPVEQIFDAGVMDIFVVRVAGNVCDVDERGSIEYGLAHVHTPVVVVMGHTQCGAVTAVTHDVQGKGHELEKNIPELVENIKPSVQRAMENHPDLKGDDVIPAAVEENVWQSIEELFANSPVTREYVSKGYAKVVGAIYDIGTGNIEWLPEEKSMDILAKVESGEKGATGCAVKCPYLQKKCEAAKAKCDAVKCDAKKEGCPATGKKEATTEDDKSGKPYISEELSKELKRIMN